MFSNLVPVKVGQRIQVYVRVSQLCEKGASSHLSISDPVFSPETHTPSAVPELETSVSGTTSLEKKPPVFSRWQEKRGLGKKGIILQASRGSGRVLRT